MNKQQLANKIWESANRMRSKIEANEYKDYILGFIFYKFLSDKEVDRLKKDGYGEDDIREYVHENNPEVVAYCQQELGYFIAYDNLFSTWLAKGNSFTVDNVRTALSAFNRLISETQKKVFSKIFNTLETGLSKLGDSTSSQTKSISELIQLIKDIPTDGKEQYKSVERTPDQQIDLLIVVDQMLTGFDSKWINTLYLDKVLVYEKLIQAFSRTNRLFGPEKPFGTIRYYRKPYTMRRNIDEAFKLYSGDKPLGLFADKLEYNLGKLNELYDEIEAIFRSAGVENFEKLPEDHTERGQFAKLFKRFNNYLEAAKIQGFTWNKLSYEIKTETGKTTVELHLDETTYLILALRYKELFSGEGTGLGGDDVPYEIDSYLTEINTGVIDANYMNSRFSKYLKALQDGTETAAVLDELHKSFATLTQEEQKYANIFLHDVQNGDVVVDEGKTLRDYITEYMTSAKNDQIHRFAEALGADETMLRDFMQLRVTEANINEFGRFDKLKATVNRDSAKVFLETLEGTAIKPFQINMKVDRILRKFILEGGFDIA